MIYPFLEPQGQRVADYLGLSMRGAATISPYPEQAHRKCFEGITRAMTKGNIESPIKLYIYLCSKYCRENSIETNVSLVNKYMMLHNISNDSDDYLPIGERVKVEVPEVKKKKVLNIRPWPKPQLYRYSSHDPLRHDQFFQPNA